jgi:predicted GTPase
MERIEQREFDTPQIEGTVHETAERLEALAALAERAGAEGIVDQASEMAERLALGRFFVACVGQFKRGKSTLLNALLERSILPTGVVPITTAVTVLRYGRTLTARVRFSDGRRADIDPERLAEYVSEAQNPENEKGVTAVDVTVPSALLASGMCLVDTPGLGSVFAANSAATRAFVPQIDAALVVLGTDPPISGEELALVEAVGAQVDHLLFILNKCDRVDEAESREAAAFTRRVIATRLDRDVDEIHRVSATERVAGRITWDWARLEEALKDLAGRSAAVLDAAATRGLSRIGHALLGDLDEQRDALTRPIQESERRLARLRQAIVDAEYAMRELSARLRVEQVALSSRFASLREAFLASEAVLARSELADAVRAAPVRRGPTCRANAIDVAQEIAKRRVTAWAQEIEPKAEALYRATTGRFVELANDFVARLSHGASDGLALRQEDFIVERGFRADAHFFFTSMMAHSSPGFWAWVLDWIRPHRLLVASAIRQATRYLERLMTTNSARVANDLTARVDESQRRLESEIHARLSVLLTTAERALAWARAQQAAGAEAVTARLAEIARLREQVEGLIDRAVR